jgi:HSP20 family protein
MLRNRDLVPQRREQQSLSPFGGSDDLFSPSSLFSGSPWQMMRRMQEDMDRLFGQVLGQGGALAAPTGGQIMAWAPHVDVSETDKEFRIEADLPGVRQEDINIQVQDGMLFLSAQMQQNQEQGQPGQPGQSGQQGQQAQGQQGQQAQGPNGQTKSGQAAPSMQTGQSGQSGQQPIQYHQRERRYGYFERVMSLPPQVDEENIQADFRDGVLTLRLPKMQQIGQQGRRIQIGGGASGASGQQIESGKSKSEQKSAAGTGSGDKKAQAG